MPTFNITSQNFVNILPVFKNEEGRNIQSLSEYYLDSDFLDYTIRELLPQNFSDVNPVKGKRILLKPNWVRHSIIDTDDICLRTNDALILSVLKLVLELKPSSVIIGDAPVQGCEWDKMMTGSFRTEVGSLSKLHNIPVVIKDFRRTTFDPLLNNPQRELHPINEYTIVDLASESWLEPISNENDPGFRVTCYDPRRLALSHSKGVHKYCVTHELFNADVIISLPKIKTHQKTGITAALKNLVGINGDKDYLPHHRFGGSKSGGDCYPGNNIMRKGAEIALDYANMNQGKKRYWLGFYASEYLWRLSRPKNVHQLAAGWYGNDTSWRMVMDLNLIARNGRIDGTISKEPQRLLLSIGDGIIGGQGDGPLDPIPLPLGVVSFTNSSALHDMCMAMLMGYSYSKIPLLAGAATSINLKEALITYNHNAITIHELLNFSVPTLPPPGWIDYLQN